MPNRYNRQQEIVGKDGQNTLADSTVFIAGAGGLGSPVSIYLVEAGIGTIRIADCDKIEETNLNRQILHPENRIGMPKVESAEKTLKSLNSLSNITTYQKEITRDSIGEMVNGVDLIIDCLDNFQSRYVLNEISHKMKIPLLHAAVSGLSGQITLVIPGKTPCLSCIFPNVEPVQTYTPSIGSAVGVVGSLEALEATRFLLGRETLAGKLLLIDLKDSKFETFNVKKKQKCPICGLDETI